MLTIYVDGSAINNENPNKPTLGGVGICIIGPADSVVANGEVHGFHYTVANDKLVDSDENIREQGEPMLELDLGKTTNNTTELAAIYVALSYLEGGELPSPIKVKIYGDSQYAGNLVFGNWKPKENKELVAKVKQLASKVPNDVTWEYVKAHADNQYNNYADYLAKSGAYKTPEREVLSFNEWLLNA